MSIGELIAAVSPNGRFAYTGNAAGGISGFAIGRDGSLTAIGTTLLTPSPRDLDFDASGRYLQAVSPGGLVTSYRVGNDGSLTVAGPVLFFLFAERAAAGPLDHIKQFMADHNAVIMMVVLLVLGAKVLGQGIGGLSD